MPGVEPAIYPGSALPSIQRQVVTEAGIQAILRAAIEAGLENGTDHTDLGSTGIADASTTVFTFEADGVSHTVKVYALGMLSERPDGMSAEEFEARDGPPGLPGPTWERSRRGSRPGRWAPRSRSRAPGRASSSSDYQPDAQLEEPAKAWPLDTPLASFGTSDGVMGPAAAS